MVIWGTMSPSGVAHWVHVLRATRQLGQAAGMAEPVQSAGIGAAGAGMGGEGWGGQAWRGM